MKKLILASQSPRRSEILKKAGYQFVPFLVYVSEIPDNNLSLNEQIIDIARRKAEAAAEKLLDQGLTDKNTIVLAADTVVCFKSIILGKPENEKMAFDFLSLLSENQHQVKTAIYILDLSTDERISHIETTEVFFRKISKQEILAYIATKEPFDKAGAYGIQGAGRNFVEKYEGDFNNVVGLPLQALENLFRLKGWDFLKNTVKSSSRSLLFSMILKNLSAKQKILAVSKLQSSEKIKALYDEGQTDFGENYIQEALKKIALLHDLKINWHFIGPIQKNKVKLLKKNFASIHSIGSYELATSISQEALKINYLQNCFIQLNLSGEATKSGYAKELFLKDWPRLNELKGLKIVGLMTMPPLENEPEKNRAFFKELKYIGSKLNLHEYSMGTSHDYQIALAEGATWIRLGTMLFGERIQKRDL